MIPRERNRLAEVEFPIAEVSVYAAREKSIRRGYASTAHLWWARRPLASSRAMLMALVHQDPCDKHCSPSFKDGATRNRLFPPIPQPYLNSGARASLLSL